MKLTFLLVENGKTFPDKMILASNKHQQQCSKTAKAEFMTTYKS